MTAVLGAIADDFTGATDLANALVRQGMRTVLILGRPSGPAPDEVDALVVALKTRTIAPADAVAQSLDALAWLREAGVRQIYFKYCSTFDSTDQGNIGPVSDALLEALGGDFSVVCPAFPGAGRTIYMGHLFVNGRLLSESSMRNHPLTPMHDADLVRVMGRQTAGAVGLAALPTVSQGSTALRAELERLRKDGKRYAVVDVAADQDLATLGEAVADFPLVTAGSGLAIGLPAAYRRREWLPAYAVRQTLAPAEPGPALVLSGSCSEATQGQVAKMRGDAPAFELDPMALSRDTDVVTQAIVWATQRLPRGPVLIYSTAEPARVQSAQRWLGTERAASLLEGAFASIARALLAAGVRRFIVAGGETAGAVVQALDVKALRIGQEIDPGVPWTVAEDAPRLALALKSGNFGAPDFFAKALRMAP
ncbi:MAG TPA: 3-oxo-tetronate kinase [Candidatus Sulfotelmatobacter sp.]|nr:3-oxo-tetronate kinase [Candidatus Sulfotelmatobacter sp.]